MFRIAHGPLGNIDAVRFTPEFIQMSHHHPGRAADFKHALWLKDLTYGCGNLAECWTVSRAFLIVAIGGPALLTVLEIVFVEIAVPVHDQTFTSAGALRPA